ncbi:MAG TPA: Sec-independent protein translocase protein TatB [Agitococcus sp.]|uniref:Sec-independent protein translocase protein TatB n=1 Tax=uncultured Agitococcus sp. TaxID=1506599 RepID=UPI00261A1915|nr:Sec-independent protein translocase protein TatB [uncultured Agitococcus sp.]HRH91400.1 Sec-independent protein translocase protein TatB [Agitococcus sp.]
MFDVGFSELILLGIVALVVLGPEKLPHAARMAGAWLGRIRRTVIDIQAEIEKEVSAAELKQRMNDEIARLKAATNPIEEEIKAVENTIHQQMTDASQTVDAAPAYLAQQTPPINNNEPQENNSVPTAPSLPPSKVNLIKS